MVSMNGHQRIFGRIWTAYQQTANASWHRSRRDQTRFAGWIQQLAFNLWQW